MNEELILDPEIVEQGSEGTVPAPADQVLPEQIYLLPLAHRPFFPSQVMPLVMSEEYWLETLRKVSDTPHHLVGLVLAHNEDERLAEPQDFARVGTVVRMHNPRREGGKVQFIAEGVRRFRIVHWVRRERPFIAQVEYPGTPDEDPQQLRAYAIAIINTIKELLPLNPLYNEELRGYLERFHPGDPEPLVDFAAALTTAGREELQEVLETIPLLRRMEKVLVLLQKELEVARMQTRIRKRVEETMSEQQRRFFLKQQLKEIQAELGISKDDRSAEIERFRERLETLELPEKARERIEQELEKLSVLETGSPEYAVTRNYLEWITALPWGIETEDKLDLEEARRILDRHHYGLEDIKQRIIEFLAVGALKGEVTGSILLLVGPPGVGKTSLGKAVAETLGRHFYRFSLGGMRDEAEIKGHRRTYIGAMPGKFIQALRETGSMNPVIMLDEIDKVGASYQGDPASALLEVLDPEQNSNFLDHYLDVPFDLSKVLFICTANQLDTIPRPLLDRMEVIRLPGYLTGEKVEIAVRHLWPRLRRKAGLKASQISITRGAIRAIAEGYAREAGVRGLEKQLSRIIRKAAVLILEDREQRIHVTRERVEEFLGPPLFRPEAPKVGVGMAIGLAWTALGGATLSVEAAKVHEKRPGFRLTGRLGEVMQESATIAYSYVRAHLAELGAPADAFDEAFIHLHVPEGATPKDGPSAGITMATALLSLARNRPIRKPVAMTGELTLTGEVLAVGGIREKLIAARRSNIREVILPEANRRDYDELPEQVRRGLRVHFVSSYPEVTAIVF